MSCTPGKVEVVGVQEVQGTEAFVLRFLQCRDDEWIGKVFFAKFDPKAIWRVRRVLKCSLCCWDSCASHDAGGRFFSDFE